MTVQDISQRAKKIRAQYPNKKWTDCIKQASKELKSGKVGAVKKRVPATKKVVLTSLSKLKKNERAVLIESFNDLPYDVYAIYVNGEYDRRVKAKKTDKKYLKKVGATKSAPANQTRRKPITKKPVSKHKDLMSHNVRINVLSGLGGKPTPLVLNGVTRVTRGSYYLLQYPDGEVSNKALFKYLKKLKTGELVFDVYQKGKSGAFNKPIQYQFPPSALLSLVKAKKPTEKELSIGHLKLLK
jgi:hypothetical protein